MILSEHLTLEEMIFSDYAKRNGLDNTPGPDEVRCLTSLCFNVLEQVRAQCGHPLIITSGYRSPKVNAGIGGAPTSQHQRGQAADFHASGMGILELVKAIDLFTRPIIPYDQLIYEFGETGWVHISHSHIGKQLRQKLEAKLVNGKTTYSPLSV
jgi:zinc D-Ala-D-Ala carboxypeptidase